MSAKTFCGWVPCVSGRLSFTLIGADGLSRDAKYFNDIREDGDRVFIYEKRFLADTPFSGSKMGPTIGRVGSKLIKGDTATYLMLDAKQRYKKGDYQLEGIIALYPSKQVGDVKPFPVKAAMSRLNALKTNPQSLGNPTAIFDDAQWRFSFVLYKDGTLELKENFGDIAEKAEEKRKKTAREQAYMFIRDAGHTHKHHNKNHDTLTMVFPKTARTTWQAEVLRRLFRATITIGRSDSWGDIVSARGFLAYTRSFKKIAERQLADTKSEAELKKYAVLDNADYIDSQDVKQQRRSIAEDHKNWGWVLVLTSTLSIFGLFVSILAFNTTIMNLIRAKTDILSADNQLAELSNLMNSGYVIDVSPSFIMFATTLMENPVWVVIFWMVVIGIIFIRTKWLLKDIGKHRTLQGLSYISRSRFKSASILFALGLAVSAIVYFSSGFFVEFWNNIHAWLAEPAMVNNLKEN